MSHIHNVTPANTARLRVALAAVRGGSANATLAFAGDSTMRGFISGGDATQYHKSWPFEMARKLTAAGLPAGWQNFFSTGLSGALGDKDNRAALSGGFATTAATSLGGPLMLASSAGSVSFTPQGNANKFDIYWLRNGIGSGNVNVDGGATLATLSAASSALQKTTVTAPGAAAPHTLNINWVSNNHYVIGVNAYDSAVKQVHCLNWAESGATTTTWNATTNIWSKFNATQFPAYIPDCIIYDIGLNDAGTSSRSKADFKANMVTWLDVMLPLCDVVLKTPAPPSTAWVSQGVVDLVSEYRDAMFELSELYDIPLIDTAGRWVNFATSNARGFYSDNVHPSAIGYTDQADQITPMLLMLA